MKQPFINLLTVFLICLALVLGVISWLVVQRVSDSRFLSPSRVVTEYRTIDSPNPQARQLVEDARSQIGVTVGYDGAYQSIRFPMGDVPESTGVCTDVVVRALRKQGVDIQELIYTDMVPNFSQYPNLWNLKQPDTNIDHRRVPNILTYMERAAKTKPVTSVASHYLPGDIVTWDFGPGQQHIGVVSDRIIADTTPLIIHNMGRGTEESDLLFQFPITGHVRYF